MAEAHETAPTAGSPRRAITKIYAEQIRGLLGWIITDINKTVGKCVPCATDALKLADILKQKDIVQARFVASACTDLLKACKKMMSKINDLRGKDELSKRELDLALFDINKIYESACTDFKAKTEAIEKEAIEGWDAQVLATKVLEHMEAIGETFAGAAQNIEYLLEVFQMA